MTDKQRAFCIAEIDSYTDRDAYVSDLALSSIWGDDEGAAVPAKRIEELGKLWDSSHRTVRKIVEASGLNLMGFSQRFAIPYRTLQNWCTESASQRECPIYVRLMMQELLGL